MNPRHVLYGLSLLFVNAVAVACEQPRLVVIPAAQSAGDASAEMIVAMQRYLDGAKEYLACIEAELTAAGGDAAPDSLRSALIRRNNNAVAEAEALAALFTERVAPLGELYLAEFIVGSGETCVSTFRMERTAVIDDLAVLFIEQDGRTYLNVLEATCLNLARDGQFVVRRDIVGASDTRLGPVQTGRLCSSEFIYPYAYDTGQSSRNDECRLGRFFELTAEQAERLLGSGPAAAPVEPEANSSGK